MWRSPTSTWTLLRGCPGDALGQVVSRAVVVATGITVEGTREVLGVDIGHSEDETFWTRFLRSLKDRGLPGSASSSATPTPG